jgi:hypothetical protein
MPVHFAHPEPPFFATIQTPSMGIVVHCTYPDIATGPAFTGGLGGALTGGLGGALTGGRGGALTGGRGAGGGVTRGMNGGRAGAAGRAARFRLAGDVGEGVSEGQTEGVGVGQANGVAEGQVDGLGFEARRACARGGAIAGSTWAADRTAPEEWPRSTTAGIAPTASATASALATVAASLAGRTEGR